MNRVAVTLDLHRGDRADDIVLACQALRARGITATVFVPSAILEDPGYRAACGAIVAAGHEPASHSHDHDAREMNALMHGGRGDLDFLARSKAIHEDCFGRAVTAFRTPCWCGLGPAAIGMLAGLGYRVDSSATPQRLGLLSSTPFDDVWTFAPRAPFQLAPGLLEIPTSCFLIPAGAPSFMILRRTGSRVLFRWLTAEAKLFTRVLTLQFHVSFFNPHSPKRAAPRKPLALADFVPQRSGGLAFKHRLRSGDPRLASAIATDILDALDPSRCMGLSAIAEEIVRERTVPRHAGLAGDP
jgi:peptidoglycan/xylan/chitin deacetylase (PgdA/CDA1 family)